MRSRPCSPPMCWGDPVGQGMAAAYQAGPRGRALASGAQREYRGARERCFVERRVHAGLGGLAVRFARGQPLRGRREPTKRQMPLPLPWGCRMGYPNSGGWV